MDGPVSSVTYRRLLLLLIGSGLIISLTGATCREIYTQSGTWYRVQQGETIASVARRFHVSAQDLAEINDIVGARPLRNGERLYIPRQWSSSRLPLPASKKERKKTRRGQDSDEVVLEPDRFLWPVDGTVTSKYGIRNGRRHDGIDIRAERGSPIKAADGGEVVFSNKLRGYGNLILVKHRDGFFTAYAHNSRNLKKKGTQVQRGEVIGRVGSTGRATAPHLHFEVRKGSNARNPLFFLPKRG
jgi:murein DD-endopeptidase MepM/ murein hydrolase activator NlpD